jgi:hypothetical protein
MRLPPLTQMKFDEKNTWWLILHVWHSGTVTHNCDTLIWLLIHYGPQFMTPLRLRSDICSHHLYFPLGGTLWGAIWALLTATTDGRTTWCTTLEPTRFTTSSPRFLTTGWKRPRWSSGKLDFHSLEFGYNNMLLRRRYRQLSVFMRLFKKIALGLNLEFSPEEGGEDSPNLNIVLRSISTPMVKSCVCSYFLAKNQNAAY